MPSVILATAGYDHTIRLWEARSGFCYRTLQYSDSQVNRLEITPNKKYLAAAGNPHIKLFELSSNNPQPVSTFSGHKSNVTSIGFEKRGEFLYSGSEDGTVRLWDPRVPHAQREYEYLEACNSVELHPSQTQLVAGYQNGVIRMYDVRTSQCLREFMPSEENDAIRSIALSADSQYACAATSRGRCFVWRLTPSEYLSQAQQQEAVPRASDGTPIDLVREFVAHQRYVLRVRFSPDVSTLATTSADHTVRIWDVKKEFELCRTLKGHQRWVWDCAYTADSAFLVTASSDHVARLWDLRNGETLRQYTGHHKAISCLALNDEEHADTVRGNARASGPPQPQSTRPTVNQGRAGPTGAQPRLPSSDEDDDDTDSATPSM